MNKTSKNIPSTFTSAFSLLIQEGNMWSPLTLLHNTFKTWFLLTPPLGPTLTRLQLSLSPSSGLSRSHRFKTLFPTLLRLSFLPLHFVLSLIDEIFYPSYHAVPIRDPIFVASTPRTGSTSLTEAIAINERDFVCPTMGEVAFPYLFLHSFLDKLTWVATSIFPSLPLHMHHLLLYVYGIDQESYERHPVGFFEKGQVEFLSSSWQWVGPGQQMAVPSPRYFSLYATLSELPPHLLLKIDEFRDQLVFQKVLFRRGQKGVGGGWWRGEERGVKRVVMKTHSSDCVKHLGERYPEGKFVFGHRMPSKQLSSCFGLFETAAKSRLGKNTTVLTPEWINTRLVWLEKMWEAELDIFFDEIPLDCHYQRKGRKGGEEMELGRERRLSINFDRFVKDFDVVMDEIFRFLLGEGCLGEEYLKGAVEKHGVKHRAYKKGRSYKNPSLESLGLDGEAIDKKFDAYIKTFIK